MPNDILGDRLSEAYADVHMPDELERVLSRGTRLRRARLSRRGIPALVVLAVAAALMVTTGPGDEGVAEIRLVAYSGPEFPVTVTRVPDGLGAPVYGLDPGFGGAQRFWLVGYSSLSAPEDHVSVLVRDDKPSDLGEQHGSVDVHGSSAGLYSSGTGELRLAWETGSGSWVVLTGSGEFADDADLRRIADGIQDSPSTVPLHVQLAPAGWQIVGYKDNRVLTLAADVDDPERVVDVQVYDQPVADFAQSVGARSSTAVKVQGSAAQLVEAQGIWMLQARTRNGTTFVLHAPAEFTRDQVIRFADGVTARP